MPNNSNWLKLQLSEWNAMQMLNVRLHNHGVHQSIETLKDRKEIKYCL